MKTGKDAVGRGGPWSERWKAWIRCSTYAKFSKLTTPSDPTRYSGSGNYMVSDFVRSWDLADEYLRCSDGGLQHAAKAQARAMSSKGASKGAKRALDTADAPDASAPASALRRS